MRFARSGPLSSRGNTLWFVVDDYRPKMIGSLPRAEPAYHNPMIADIQIGPYEMSINGEIRHRQH
jgi:hypothetical protein